MPILACAMHADEGALRSGVEVATIIKSISFGSSPAEAIAFRPARAARSDVYSSGSAMHRSRIPNVSTIHSGEVGKFLACAMHADEGALRSGVEVATIIKSISFGSSPAEAIAFRPDLN